MNTRMYDLEYRSECIRERIEHQLRRIEIERESIRIFGEIVGYGRNSMTEKSYDRIRRISRVNLPLLTQALADIHQQMAEES